MKKTYDVVNAVDHNQKRTEAGGTITLDDEFAAPLLAVGAIAEQAADDKSKK
jgi:hypothetical protein